MPQRFRLLMQCLERHHQNHQELGKIMIGNIDIVKGLSTMRLLGLQLYLGPSPHVLKINEARASHCLTSLFTGK